MVSGSRYMKGGSQTGGPLLKRTAFAPGGAWPALGHADEHPRPDDNFRAYSARFLRNVEVQSRKSFEVALELTVKAHVLGYKVDEVPSSWEDRSAGKAASGSGRVCRVTCIGRSTA